MIAGNIVLPYSYIASFTVRNNNEYMWPNYAEDDRVVFVIDVSLI